MAELVAHNASASQHSASNAAADAGAADDDEGEPQRDFMRGPACSHVLHCSPLQKSLKRTATPRVAAGVSARGRRRLSAAQIYWWGHSTHKVKTGPCKLLCLIPLQLQPAPNAGEKRR